MTGLMLVFIILSLTFMSIAKEKIDELHEQKKNIIVILSEKLASSKVNVEYDNDKGTVTLSQDILFELNKTTLNNSGRKFINTFGKVLDKNIFAIDKYVGLIKYIHIEGYASREGAINTNFTLSFQRALNVWQAMLSHNYKNQTIMKSKLNIVSRGEVDANQAVIDAADRKVVFRFEFYDTYDMLFEGLTNG